MVNGRHEIFFTVKNLDHESERLGDVSPGVVVPVFVKIGLDDGLRRSEGYQEQQED